MENRASSEQETNQNVGDKNPTLLQKYKVGGQSRGIQPTDSPGAVTASMGFPSLLVYNIYIILDYLYIFLNLFNLFRTTFTCLSKTRLKEHNLYFPFYTFCAKQYLVCSLFHASCPVKDATTLATCPTSVLLLCWKGKEPAWAAQKGHKPTLLLPLREFYVIFVIFNDFYENFSLFH